MANVVSAQTTPQATSEYEAAFEQLMEEAESINERMGQDRVKIERLEAQTKATVEDIVRLRAETRALLASMGAKL